MDNTIHLVSFFYLSFLVLKDLIDLDILKLGIHEVYHCFLRIFDILRNNQNNLFIKLFYISYQVL